MCIFVNNNGNGSFHYNAADAKLRVNRRKTLGIYVQNNKTRYAKLQCLKATGKCRASKQLRDQVERHENTGHDYARIATYFSIIVIINNIVH